ncbi:MAG: prolyl oligopeptidase family serine peptidase [Candidatus Njordarchaeia archaeon]
MSDGLAAEDFSKIVFVSDPKVSPRGDQTLFTVTKPDMDGDRYISRIWLLNNKTREMEPVTNGPSDHSPIWSPDGTKIAFVSRRTLKEDEPGSELWIMRIDGKYEPHMVLKMKGGVNGIQWSPDGRKIAFSSIVGEPDKDVMEIEKIPVWFNGSGYVYKKNSHIFVVDVATGNVEQITKGDVNAVSPMWSPDGARLAYIVQEDELKPYISNIYVYNFKTGEAEKLTRDNYSIYEIAWDPSGKNIAFRGSDLSRGFASFTRLYILPLEDKEVRLLVKMEKSLENPANCDTRGPSSAKHLQWIDKHIYFPVADGGSVHLYRTNILGKIEALITGDLVVDDFAVGGNRVVATIMTSTMPNELYFYDFRNLVKVSSFNDETVAKFKLNKPEKFKFKASDGAEIEGWVLKPRNFKEGEKYPTILEIHGGPATTYGNGFMFEFHYLSSNGFAVIFTNPRGSSGYTEDFADIRGKYGDRDYKDLMEAVEYVVNNYNFIDSDKLGVTGGSYGGFMTNWIIGHTDKFKAAVTQRSISNWISFYGTTDIGFYFAPDQMAKGFENHFWVSDEVFNKYWEQSPIKYIKNAKTPLLIIHSMEDYRCWLDQALQMFTALKVNGVETKLVLFPKENHDLSRTGKPKHKATRLQEILNWFNKHLKEKD